MLRSSQYENELIGSIDDINVSDIFESLNPLRTGSSSVLELSDSIGKIGLLSPILVRITDTGKFEVVAGNRRFKACKSLGWKKISCRIVELDDRRAFEASIVENIQRNTLNIIEEGIAFRRYVNEFGWGAASELAGKLSKSASYVSKRMKLLDLPVDILQLLTASEISVAKGEELLSIKDRDKQSRLAKMALKQSMSSKEIRRLIRQDKCQLDDYNNLHITNIEEENKKILKAFDNTIISLRIALNRIGLIIEKIEGKWIFRELLMNHKNAIHSEIDLLIREKKKFVNRNHFFRVNF